MSETIPKTLPRSTLACPPAKNFTEQYAKPSQTTGPSVSQKPSTTNFEKVGKKESEKEFNLKPVSKESTSSKNDNFGSSGANFRSSSKDIKQASTKNLPFKPEPSSSKKEKGIIHSEIHVKKWVDYSTKYGLGYLLSDGSTGVYFNDSTKIIVDRNGDTF